MYVERSCNIAPKLHTEWYASKLLNIPANMIIKALAGVSNISTLPVYGAIALIIISMLLTVIAGLVPSKMAAKKDPVESLRVD